MSGSVPNTSPEFQRFPMWMRHPAERPAVVSDDYAAGERRATDARPGAILRFPPVMVQNEDQEEYHRAQGYEPTAGNPTAFLKATIAPDPPGYQHHEYPRMSGGLIDQGPDAPQPPDNYYPLWVRMEGYEPTLVQNKDEHEALLSGRGVEPPDPAAAAEAEIAELERRLAELRAKSAPAERPQAADIPHVELIESPAEVAEPAVAPKRRGRPPNERPPT